MDDRVELRKNNIIEVIIEDMGTQGEGIGKYNGYPLFIKDVIIGEKVSVLVLKTKKNYGYAKLLKILEPSPDRINFACSVASKCGGCQLQHLKYEKQLEYKQNKVRNCLERIGGIRDVKMEDIMGMETPYYYRNKAQFPVGRGKDGEVLIGFYAERTHSIINTMNCYIQAKINERILQLVREFLVEEEISIYDERKHSGRIRYIMTRIGFYTGEVMVCLVINGNSLPKKEKLIQKLLKIGKEQEFYQITSICLNVNKQKTNVILGEEIISLFGEPYITDFIGKIRYQISPLSFYQVNPIQTKKLYEKVLEFANLNGTEIVWDLYCGIGTISLFLAQKAKVVYGVEIVPQAIEDAKQNAKRNNITNAEFFVGAAEDIMPKKYIESQGEMKADVIVIDPPRKGCDESLLQTITKMTPEKVIYVSCDPATLARDLKYLIEAGYEVKKVQVVDQFSGTYHVESVVLMSRK